MYSEYRKPRQNQPLANSHARHALFFDVCSDHSVEGAQASVDTHVPNGGMALVDTPPSTPPESQQAKAPTTVFTLLRMKAHTHNGGASSGPPPPANGSGQCCARCMP